MLLLRPGEEPVVRLTREGVTQGDPLYRVLDDTTFAPLAEELRPAALDLMAQLYANYSAFDDQADRSARLMILLLKREPARG